jgi:hypothetical protein
MSCQDLDCYRSRMLKNSREGVNRAAFWESEKICGTHRSWRAWNLSDWVSRQWTALPGRQTVVRQARPGEQLSESHLKKSGRANGERKSRLTKVACHRWIVHHFRTECVAISPWWIDIVLNPFLAKQTTIDCWRQVCSREIPSTSDGIAVWAWWSAEMDSLKKPIKCHRLKTHMLVWNRKLPN